MGQISEFHRLKQLERVVEALTARVEALEKERDTPGARPDVQPSVMYKRDKSTASPV